MYYNTTKIKIKKQVKKINSYKTKLDKLVPLFITFGIESAAAMMEYRVGVIQCDESYCLDLSLVDRNFV